MPRENPTRIVIKLTKGSLGINFISIQPAGNTQLGEYMHYYSEFMAALVFFKKMILLVALMLEKIERVYVCQKHGE